MTTPRVTEMPLRLEPVEPDPFIAARSRSSDVRPRPVEREERERRVELVRRFLRVRNGTPARRTERA
jgi:hypothetical protein